MEDLKNESKVLVKEIIKQQNAREHLANERTLLAWIRTSIGIMAFGFVVVKFSLFIKQISLLLGKNANIPSQHGYSSVIGILLVAVGALVLLLSYLKYKKTEKQLNNEDFRTSSTLTFSLTIIILLISILLILYLVENTGRY
ncbi:MAG: YidH family protein [Bacteroidia bacterium]